MFTTNLKTTRRLTQAMVAAGAMTVLGAGVVAACHPQGVIAKDVQDITTKSATMAADTSATALNVHPGDTLVYYITVSNLATGDKDEMINTVVTDSLPAGLQIISHEDYNLGTVGMKQNVMRKLTVKVTATTAQTIKNTACFTGDSKDHKVPQKGCDLAYVKVIVPTPAPTVTPTPTTTPTPSSTPTPSPTPTPQVLGATTLPDTGSPVAGTMIGLGAMISTGVAYLRSRKQR